MTIQDMIPQATLERVTSDDINNRQNIINRELAEVVRSMVRTLEVQKLANPPIAQVRTHIASGLQGEAIATPSIIINPGVLMQQVSSSPPDVPAPGALDSTYRFGLQMTTVDVGDPWDGTNAFWLLEARVVRTTTLSEIRDIYNPGTSTFAPSAVPIDKRYESQIEFQWLKDPNPAVSPLQLPITRTAGWAPILGCYRAAVLAPIADADVFQLAWQLEDISPQTIADGHPVRNDFRFRTTEGIGAVCTGFEFNLDAEVAGARCMAASESTIDFHLADYIEAASAAALNVNNTWGYVYLAPVNDLMPSGLYPNVQHRGALVVSRTPPDDYGRNTAVITAPPPLNENIKAGGAVCIAVCRSGGASWQYINIGSSGEGRVEIREFNNNAFPMTSGADAYGTTGSPWSLATIGAGGTEDVPYGVHWKCFIDPTSGDAVAVAVSLETTFGMAGDSASQTRYPRMLLPTHELVTFYFELYARNGYAAAANMLMTVTFTPRTIAMANSGGGAADGGNAAYRAGLWGIRF